MALRNYEEAKPSCPLKFCLCSCLRTSLFNVYWTCCNRLILISSMLQKYQKTQS